MPHLVSSQCLVADHGILLPPSAMWGDALCMSLQGILLVEVQFTGLVVCFTEERIPIFKGFGQGVPLERPVLLSNFRGSLFVPNHMGVIE